MPDKPLSVAEKIAIFYGSSVVRARVFKSDEHYNKLSNDATEFYAYGVILPGRENATTFIVKEYAEEWAARRVSDDGKIIARIQDPEPCDKESPF